MIRRARTCATVDRMSARLRVYRFGADAVFEGRLIGALERLQLGAPGRLLDALAVLRDPATDAVHAVDLATGRAGASLATLLDFRLDAARRAAITERTLAQHPGGVPRAAIEAAAEAMGPGEALLAVLHAGDVPAVLEDAVGSAGGHVVADEGVDARTLAELADRVTAAASA
jgi:hypothetical protein